MVFKFKQNQYSSKKINMGYNKTSYYKKSYVKHYDSKSCCGESGLKIS